MIVKFAQNEAFCAAALSASAAPMPAVGRLGWSPAGRRCGRRVRGGRRPGLRDHPAGRSPVGG